MKALWLYAFCICALLDCVGTHQQREALRTLTPIHFEPLTLPASAPSDLSPAARQLEALTQLKPLPEKS